MTPSLTPLPTQRPGLHTSPGRTGIAYPVLPFSNPQAQAAPPPKPACSELPGPGTNTYPTSWPNPFSILPSDTPSRASARKNTPSFPSEIPSEPARRNPAPRPVHPLPSEPEAADAEPEPDFTDADLQAAFAPLVQGAVLEALSSQDIGSARGIGDDLEPMLRATIRRALAEYTPASKPFQQPGGLDRLVWQMQALFTSRSYEDVIFDKTRRFQVEEAFLLDIRTLALVSFASSDPARHASARRVADTVLRLASQLRDAEGKLRNTFPCLGKRTAIALEGHKTILVAVVRGTPGEFIISDLEFAHKRVEKNFRKQLSQEGSDLLRPIQPFLEDCLLIQSPATTAN